MTDAADSSPHARKAQGKPDRQHQFNKRAVFERGIIRALPTGEVIMSLEDAVALIINEARAGEGDGLLASVRRGEDPGAERMRLLVSALQTVFHSLRGQAELDRQLAAALFTLGSDVPLTISSQAGRGQTWRRGFMEEEVYELLMGVQSIFEDRWLDAEPLETIH
jgi:hypothetical protein